MSGSEGENKKKPKFMQNDSDSEESNKADKKPKFIQNDSENSENEKESGKKPKFIQDDSDEDGGQGEKQDKKPKFMQNDESSEEEADTKKPKFMQNESDESEEDEKAKKIAEEKEKKRQEELLKKQQQQEAAKNKKNKKKEKKKELTEEELFEQLAQQKAEEEQKIKEEQERLKKEEEEKQKLLLTQQQESEPKADGGEDSQDDEKGGDDKGNKKKSKKQKQKEKKKIEKEKGDDEGGEQANQPKDAKDKKKGDKGKKTNAALEQLKKDKQRQQELEEQRKEEERLIKLEEERLEKIRIEEEKEKERLRQIKKDQKKIDKEEKKKLEEQKKKARLLDQQKGSILAGDYDDETKIKLLTNLGMKTEDIQIELQKFKEMREQRKQELARQKELKEQRKQQKEETKGEENEEKAQKKQSEEIKGNWEDELDSTNNTTKSTVDQSGEQVQKPPKKPSTEVQQNQVKKESEDNIQVEKQKHKQPSKKGKKDKEVLRSPIICILGHVDTGKTTLLDKLRNTNVQGGEAGGITQQIGATFFPGDKVESEIAKCRDHYPTELKAPGILVIDTPGHESFSNLRSRGSGLCDFAILVIDLMHGLEKQTIESMNLLRQRKTPFVIALNKIDRCYDWQSKNFGSSYLQLNAQSQNTKSDFENRLLKTVTELNEQLFNVALYWEGKSAKEYVPIVPTSGITGEGIPDLLSVIVKYTSFYMQRKMCHKDDFNCTVMEVKMIEGHGTTIDAILVDGVLTKGDTIVLMGFKGPIVTQIRAILTPHPMKEMRVKGEYISHDVLYASMGVKISAPNLEDAVAGSAMYLANDQKDRLEAINLVNKELEDVKNKVKLQQQGVGVAASTLGSLEALLTFLEQENIPVSYVTVGPVSKEDVTKAMKALISDDPQNRKKEFACMLVFDVKVLQDAQVYADIYEVKIFQAQIIYHLCTEFKKYFLQCQEERKREKMRQAIFPCILKPIKVFNMKDPIVIGANVERGQLRIGTPLCLYNEEKTKIGIVQSIEKNHKPLTSATVKTGDIAVKIKDSGNLQVGRTFEIEDKGNKGDRLISIINRYTIDCLKEFFRDEVSMDEWKLIKEKLKPFFEIY